MTPEECLPGVRVRLNKLGKDDICHDVSEMSLGLAWLNHLADVGEIAAWPPHERPLGDGCVAVSWGDRLAGRPSIESLDELEPAD